MGIQSESALTASYSLIESGKFEDARVLLEEALTADFENDDLVFAVLSCKFWISTMEKLSQLDCYSRGEGLVSQWRQYKQIILKQDKPLEQTVYSIRKGIYSLALFQFNKASDEKDPKLHAELCRKKGLCYKKLGSYETALNNLTEANSIVQDSASILAEMADCYALCGETKLAKILFREAFFLKPEDIDLDYLDAPLVTLLVEQVKTKGYSGDALNCWIPVYGVLLGVFNVKRELSSREVGHLKQEIYSMENQLKDPANDSAILTPKLLNEYFWLIDHYLATKDSISKINEVLLKIKILDPVIYKVYVK